MIVISKPKFGRLSDDKNEERVNTAPSSQGNNISTLGNKPNPIALGLAANSGYTEAKQMAAQAANRQIASDLLQRGQGGLRNTFSGYKDDAETQRERTLLSKMGLGENWGDPKTAFGSAIESAAANTTASLLNAAGTLLVDDRRHGLVVDSGDLEATETDVWHNRWGQGLQRNADRVQQISEEAYARGSENLNEAEQVLFDLGIAGAQMLGDMAAGPASPYLLAARGFGGGAMQARQAGGGIGQQVMYGGLSAGLELLTEKMFDGVAKAYGKGAADDVIKKVAEKLAKTPQGQSVIRAIANAGGEGLEEMISAIVDPALQTIYNDKTINGRRHGEKGAYDDVTIADILYDGLIGSLLGSIGGGIDIYQTAKQNPVKQMVETLKQAGASDEDAEKLAPMMTSLLNGEEISGNQAAAIATNEAAIKELQAQTGETINTDAPLGEVKKAVRELASRQSAQASESVTEDTPKAETAQAASESETGNIITRMGKMMGKAGETVMNGMYAEGQDSTQYAESMVRAYNAGLNGRDISEAKIFRDENGAAVGVTDMQINEAFKAGQTDAQTALAKEKAAANYAKVAGTDSGLVYDDYVSERLGKTTAERVNSVAKALGVRVRFVDSVAGGKANAQYSGSEILIEKDNPHPTLFLLGHEWTHRMQDLAPEAYRDFRNALASDARFEAAVEDRIRLYEEHGRSISYDAAADEVAADYAGELLQDGKMLDEFIAKHKENRTVLEKMLDAIRDLIRKLTGAEKRMAQTAEGKLMAALDKAEEQAVKIEKNVKTAEVNTKMLEDVDVGFDAETESVHPDYSLKTWEESEYVEKRNEAAKDLAAVLGISERKAKAYIDSVNSVAKMIADEQGRLDYEDSPGRSSFVSNVEYGGSFDFSTLCKKRRLLTGTFTAIQKALPNTALTADEILEIRNMMADKGLEVSCGLCYVEGSRANMGGFTKEFINLYKKYNPGKWAPNMAEMNTPDGIEWVRINHPEVYEQYEYFWNHYGTLKDGDPKLFASQQKPKLYQLHTAYKGEVLKQFSREDTDAVDAKNKNGGIRFQSFSDFEIVHLIDTMQVIMDMSRVGLAGQAYTKVPDFAWALGDTGMKINLSLIAKDVDENGNLIFDNREGMNIDDAMALRDNYSENVGTILVAFTDEQIKAAMADDRIDFIIPFHRSQWKKRQYGAMGLPANTKDYTYQQNEKLIKKTYHEYRGRMVADKATNYMPNEYWDFTISGKENAERYLEMCAADNKRPKFYKFLQNNGDGSYSLQPDGSTNGYWKLLIDFKMYDNEGNGVPQRPVRPDYNMEEVNRMLTEYQGGHTQFPVAHGVVDEFVEKYKDGHKGVKYSLKTIVDDTGKNYGTGVKLDSTLLDNLTEEERRNKVTECIKNLGGSELSAYDASGKKVIFTIAKWSQKFKNKKGKRIAVNKDFAYKYIGNDVKKESIVLLDELVSASKFDAAHPPSYSHDWLDNYGQNDWEYWVTYVEDKNNTIWAATLNIANTANGEKILYDINPIREVGRSIKLDTLPTNITVAEVGEDVNTATEKNSLKGTTALIEEYGAIEPGEKPVRDVQVPRKTEKNKNVSKTVRTIMEAEATPEEMLPNIEEMVEKGEFSYETYGDKEAISNAESKIKHTGWASALTEWTKSVESGEVSKDNTAMGWTLYNNAANSGDTQTALTVLDYMVKHQRSAAQALQATRILKKLSPETQLYQAQQSVNNLQEDLNKKYGDAKSPKLKIDEELAKRFMTARDQDARDAVMKEIYRDIGKQLPSTFMDKWNAWRYLAMLGNARTHGRNFIGNAMFAPVVATKNLTATAIESMVSRVSGGKLQRTKSIAMDQKLLKAAWYDYDKVAETAMDGGKYSDMANANKYIEEGRRVFKFAPLEAARRGNSKALEKEDEWFSKPHYTAAMASYCKANGITAEQIAKGGEAVSKARAYAIKEAQKATYRDTNAFSQMVSGWGRKGGKNSVEKGMSMVMEGILPFRKTPANILVRGLEYSPVGLMNGIKQTLWDVSRGNKTGAEAIDTLSAGLTGTGLMALGIYLAAEGLVRGHGDKEEEKNKFMELMGHQAYALELPNGTSITLDWLAPECLTFFVGVNLWEQTGKENDKVTLSSILDSVSMVTEPFMEMSCLQSLNDVFDAVGYASDEGLDALPSALASSVTSYLTQGLPTLLGQGERSYEDVRMTTYTEKNAFLTGDMQYALGKASARIPGWDYQQIPYIDAWGRKESSGAVGERSFNNFINPAYTSDIDESAMEKELLRLYETTGETKVFPDRAAKYFNVDKVRIDLTAEQYVKYATAKGQTAQKLMTALTKSSAYKAMSNADKVDAVSKVYEYANAVAKTKVSGYKLDGWAKKAYDVNKKTGVKIDQYISLYLAEGDIGSLKDKSGNTIDNSHGLLVMEEIYKVKGLTDEQRQALFEAFGVGKKVRHYNKALVAEKLAQMRNQ